MLAYRPGRDLEAEAIDARTDAGTDASTDASDGDEDEAAEDGDDGDGLLRVIGNIRALFEEGYAAQMRMPWRVWCWHWARTIDHLRREQRRKERQRQARESAASGGGAGWGGNPRRAARMDDA